MSLSPLIIVFVTVFIDLLGFGIIIPLLPFYAETFGATAFTVGLLATSFSLMQFIFAPIWGRVSDRVGRRPIILLGLLGSCLSYFGFGMASTLTSLFAARIFAGIAGANIPTAQAVVADLTTPENRARGMGMVGAAFGLGFIFGPAIGGFLSRYGYSVPAFFASGLSLVNFVAAWFLLPETLKPEHRALERVGRIDALRSALARPHLPLLLVIGFLVVAAFSAFESTFALFAERSYGFGASSIGYVFAFVGIVLVIVQGFLVGRVVKRIGEHHIVPASLAIVAIGLLMIPATRSVAALLVANGVMAVGMGLLNSLARIVGPLWGGFAFDHLGIGMPYITSAAVMGIAAALSIHALWRSQMSAGA